MGRGALLVVEERRPVRANERLGAVKPGVEVERADQGLDHVADDIVAERSLILARLLAEADVARQVDRAADLGAGLARDEGIVTAAHLAFGLAGEAFVKPCGNDQPEHAIAKEFEPLIGVAAVAAVSQRTLENAGVGWAVAGQVGDRLHRS